VTRLVLVPGFTQTASSWDAVLAGLHPSFDVRAIDVPVRESFEATAAAIGDEGESEAIYCGYSMGGRLCLRLALDRPEVVRGLVLVSATAGIESADERAARAQSDEALARSVERDGVPAFLDRWLAQPLFAGVPPDAPGVADRRTLTADYLAHCLRVLGTGTMRPMWSDLSLVTAPVTVVTGRRDEKFTELGRRLTAALPRAQHVELDCGHAVPLEAPDALAEQLDAQR
jgi:2-succinyl-6-hydroxy-2,4-cyclohexadiene-1-carboxylate synthase